MYHPYLYILYFQSLSTSKSIIPATNPFLYILYFQSLKVMPIRLCPYIYHAVMSHLMFII